ncbi:MAG: oligosaccharide flippase family protein [Rhizobacter sp.]
MTAAAPRLLKTLPAVYAAAAVRLLLPVLILPLMATRLGAEEFGRLSFVLVWASLLSMIVEGGFLAAATRLAVTADAARRWQIARQVFSARWLLCVPAVLLAIVAVQLAGPEGHKGVDTLAIAALACALGWPATWYLQATQQLARWARVELAVYALLIGLSWAFADCVQTYVLLQLTASALLAWWGWRWVRRDLSGASQGLWSLPAVAPGLRLGWTMMPVSIAGAAYSFALPAAASLQMSKADLGTYFMADRLVRAVLNAAEPVFAVVYPRIVTLFQQGARAALRYAAAWSVGGVAVGLALLAAGVLGWQLIEPLVLLRAGNVDLAALRATMLVLGLLLPLLLGWKFIGYWMLGSGRFDHAYRACVVVGGVAGTLAAATWGGAAGPVGLAWVAIGVELLVIAVAVGGMLLTRR